MGRKMLFPEKLLISFAEGTKARIDAVRGAEEDVRAFIREAIEREIRRRQRAK
jgi:hypothetical protein